MAFRSEALEESKSYTGPGDAKAEITGEVHFPAGLPGRYPLVVMIHGNNPPCYFQGKNRWGVANEWPCRGRNNPLPSYTGFRSAAAELASHGAVVVSISANGVNLLTENMGNFGARQRGKLIAAHLRLWQRWNGRGGPPFAKRFRGAINMSKIGLMGHSRGGEGVISFARRDLQADRPFGIDAVLALAPTNLKSGKLTQTPLGVVLPYCDGDVLTLEGARYFDAARYALRRDPAPKHLVTIYGASHGFFNSTLTPSGGYPTIAASGDALGRCAGKLHETEQLQISAQVVSTYFRRYLTKETVGTEMWTGAADFPEMPGEPPIVDYHAPSQRRLDVDRFTTARSVETNDTGGAVTAAGLSIYRWCANRKVSCLPGIFADDSRGGFGPLDAHYPGLSQAVLGWSAPGGSLRFDLAADVGDLTRYNAFRLRIAPNPGYEETRANPDQAMTIRLTDASGASAHVPVSGPAEPALSLAPGVLRELGPGEVTREELFAPWQAPNRTILHQVRVNLSRFAGVDLRAIRAVELVFDSPAGAVGLADVAFTG